MEILSFNSEQVKQVWLDGRLWLVANLAMIVPDSVLNGSRGSLYYPASECRASVPEWEGVPITIRHPHDPVTNAPLSASDDGVWERQGVGVVKDPTFTDKLRAKGWFDAERTRRISPEVYNALMAGKPVELSTGLYTDNEPAYGMDSKGRTYDHIARNYRSDHLAVLPDQIGACSTRDGCGVLVNSSSQRTPRRPDGIRAEEKHAMGLLERFMNWFTINGGRDPKGQFSSGGNEVASNPGEYGPEDGPIDPLTGEPIFKGGKPTKNEAGMPEMTKVGPKGTGSKGIQAREFRTAAPTDNAKCPDCGKPMMTDNCPCGYARNAMRCPMCGGEMDEEGECEECGFTLNANPEGVNQYSKGGTGTKDTQSHSGKATQRAIEASKKANESGEYEHHEAAYAAHNDAAFAHARAGKAAKAANDREAAAHHEEQRQRHQKAMGSHQRAMDKMEDPSLNARHLETGQFLPNGAPSKKQVAAAVAKGHSGDAPAKPVGSPNAKGDDGRDVTTIKEEGEDGIDPADPVQPPVPILKVSNAMPFPNQPDPTDAPQHQMTKQAASASLMAEHPPAMEHANSAMSASADGDSGMASKFHKKAAAVHEGAATDARQDGDQQEAEEHDAAGALHRKAASMHAATCNKAWFTTNGWATLDGGQHVFIDKGGKMDVHGPDSSSAKAVGASKEANEASANADAKGNMSTHHAAAQAHVEAGKAHDKASDETSGETRAFHNRAREAHFKEAEYHERKVSGRPSQNARANNVKITTRTEALRVLTSNCRCTNSEQQALNSLSDSTLLKLANNDGGPEAADGGKSGKAIQAGGEEDDEDNEADETPGGDLPAVKAKGTVENWLEVNNAPPAVRNVVHSAVALDRSRRKAIALQLVGNLQGEERKELFHDYMSMELRTLQRHLKARGTVQNFAMPDYEEERTLNYLGAAGAPVNNAFDGGDVGEGDVLPLPVMNWADDAKQAN